MSENQLDWCISGMAISERNMLFISFGKLNSLLNSRYESWIVSLAFDPNVLSIVIGGYDEKVLDPDVYSIWETSPAFILLSAS